MSSDRLHWMPLDVERLQASEFFAAADNAQLGAALRLWMRAWQQSPRGFLPKNQKILANWAGISEKNLEKNKKIILKGFLDVGDRYKHSVIFELAQQAEELVRKREERRAAGADRMRVLREKQSAEIEQKTAPETASSDAHVTRTNDARAPHVCARSPIQDRTEQNKTEHNNSALALSRVTPAPQPAPSRDTPTREALAVRAMRIAGLPLSQSNPSNPRLLEALDAGVTPEDLAESVRSHLAKPLGWHCAAALGRLQDERAKSAELKKLIDGARNG
jgi:uncharacterized protein YdaU (DUF1376 family)